MDANKTTKLRELGYCIQPGCWCCKHSSFHVRSGSFAQCFKHTFDHPKHAAPGAFTIVERGDERPPPGTFTMVAALSDLYSADDHLHLGVHRSGLCFDFELSTDLVEELHGYREFLKE